MTASQCQLGISASSFRITGLLAVEAKLWMVLEPTPGPGAAVRGDHSRLPIPAARRHSLENARPGCGRMTLSASSRRWRLTTAYNSTPRRWRPSPVPSAGVRQPGQPRAPGAAHPAALRPGCAPHYRGPRLRGAALVGHYKQRGGWGRRLVARRSCGQQLGWERSRLVAVRRAAVVAAAASGSSAGSACSVERRRRRWRRVARPSGVVWRQTTCAGRRCGSRAPSSKPRSPGAPEPWNHEPGGRHHAQ
jgi:hypothetical protein